MGLESAYFSISTLLVHPEKHKTSQNQMIKRGLEYPRPGSNRHAFKGQGILSPSCLPIPPLRHLHKKSRFDSGPCGAENETRTRDPDLGKVVLYQLSYFRFRIAVQKYNFFQYRKHFRENFSFFVVFSLFLRQIDKRF